MTQPQPDQAAVQPDWRCTATNPEYTDPNCWLPAGHHGRDASNDWDLHQNANGDQW